MTTIPERSFWPGPSLAMTMAAACALMVGGVDVGNEHPARHIAACVSDARDPVAEAIRDLSRLEHDMARFTDVLCQEDVPGHLLLNQPFGLIADNLRYVEKMMRSVEVPDSERGEFNAVLRAVAKARSVAATNDSLIRQRTTVPEVYESDVNPDALKTLVEYTTRRLNERAS